MDQQTAIGPPGGSGPGWDAADSLALSELAPFAWRSPLAERLGGATWRSDLAERFGGVTWQCDLAVWPGGATWRSQTNGSTNFDRTAGRIWAGVLRDR